MTVIGCERMLPYEDRFEKRGITLYDHAIDPLNGNGTEAGVPIVPITHFAAHRLEVPAAVEPLALAAEHVVDSLLAGTEPLTSVEVLEAAEHAATRGERAA